MSEDAMTIDKFSISQMASNLLLNYCMFDNASSTLSFKFSTKFHDWLQLKRNFPANLQNEISILSGGTNLHRLLLQ
ncbi:AVN_HP_G0119970.mRNA.1.CDS.1 [Saccharomyces cerevisiae]|nr:AVN_HP_G0119970.mRNA.1.CDS.1 [Saccharomyces cerevisiae]CAI6997070.1 AVN_HP_G0119970.mRNA.1.CDS.1 [Saccharomyces cerevisiae]